MVLFIGDSEKVVVPFNRIFKILQINSCIRFYYDVGEYVWLDSEKYVPKIEECIVHYNSFENANVVMRNFYKAFENGNSVFYFGGDF